MGRMILQVRDLVMRLEAEHIHVPIVACGISNDARAAVAAIHAGAKEYIPLPPDPELIAAVLAAVANDSRDLVYRDEAMAKVIKLAQQIASALDLIIQISRLKDGSRKITNITEVQGMEGDTIVLQDVFVFEQTGYVEGKVQGRLRPTGIRPKFSEKFESAGIKLPQNVFGDMSAGLR